MNTQLLKVDSLTTRFYTEDGVVTAVDGNSFDLEEAETLGIVGESGSGKTVTVLSIMRLIEEPGEIESGTILYRGENLLEKSNKEMRSLRGNDIGMVFQDSLSSLNPTYTIGGQISRVMKYHTDFSQRKRKNRAIEILDNVGIPEPEKRAKNYPHEFSGGMRQRALIAMAISCNPSILILDEPTTALDVTIEAQIFELVDDLKEDFGMGTILITHDLAVVANSCDRAAIMYAGNIVEKTDIIELYDEPLHPYTIGLLNSIPDIDSRSKATLPSIPGEVPDLINLPEGCNFSPRCEYAKEECRSVDPPLEEKKPNRFAACIRVSEIN
jgi:oligopeptide/dipeptide ABC transporter ATP-binding protein